MGALTLKTFSDELREWEFIESEGIDPTDSFGVNLRLSIREDQIFLAEPNDVNIPWLTDKGRLFFDGMFEKSSKKSIDWGNFFQEVFELIYFTDHLNLHKRHAFILIFAFENLSLETLNMLYLLKQSTSLIELKRIEAHSTFNDLESQFQLSQSMDKSKLYQSTLSILINVNPRYEGYALNLNLRQRFLKGNFKVFNIGSILDLTFPSINLGSNFGVVQSLAEGTHVSCQDIKNAEFPTLVTNTELFKRKDAKVFTRIFKYISLLDATWAGTNVLNHNIGSAGISLLNKFMPLSTEDFANFFGLYYINASLNSTASMKRLIDLQLLKIFNSTRFVPQRVFIDQNIHSFNKSVYEKSKNIIFNQYFHLPSNLFLEDSETYINTQGLIKRTTKLIHFRKDSKTNWQITRKFYANTNSLIFLNNTKDNALITFDSINLFNFKNYVNFQFYAVQALTSLSFYLTKKNSPLNNFPITIKQPRVKVINSKIKGWLDDFFNGSGKDSFSYNSSVLVNCSKIMRTSKTNFF